MFYNEVSACEKLTEACRSCVKGNADEAHAIKVIAELEIEVNLSNH